MKVRSKSIKNCAVVMMCIMLIAAALAGCAGQTPPSSEPEAATSDRAITIGDGQWASIGFGTALMKFIIENGYGYKTEVVSEPEEPMQLDAEAGRIDIIPEWWMYDQARHDQAKADGKILDVRKAFDCIDGLWVPNYVVNGDPEKGIEAAAPDLKTMEDLKKYTDVFQDPGDPGKGLIQLGVEGWTANPDMVARMEKYDLASVYNYKYLKEESELAANVEAKLEKGEPIVFYDYMPAGLLGKYDFIHIEDPVWEANPQAIAQICASVALSEDAPDIYTFLENYEIDLTTRNKILAGIEANGLSYDDAAKQFLKDYPDLWTAWVTDAAEEKINVATGIQ